MSGPVMAVVASPAAADTLVARVTPEASRVHAISTHPGVEDYLTTRGIAATDLSRFLDEDDFRSNQAMSERLVETLVTDLDAAHRDRLSEALGLDVSLDWFSALYATSGRYDLFGLLNGVSAIARAVREIQPAELAVYGRSSFSVIDPDGDLPPLVAAAAGRDAVVAPLESASPTAPAPRSVRALAVQARHAALELRNAARMLTGGRVSILFESLYDLGFLRHSRALGPTLVWGSASDPWLPGANDVDGARLDAFAAAAGSLDLGAAPAGSTSVESVALSLLCARIERDLRKNARRYGASLLRLRNLLRRQRVERGVWGNDPIVGAKALLVECLLKSGIEVVGCQHGAVYGTHVCNEQAHSAYARCTRFLSYGSARQDADETSSRGAGGTEIVPVGSYRVSRGAAGTVRAGRPVVDLFYPATNAVSVLCSSQRMKVDRFVAMQKALLDRLERLPLDRVVVKLPPPTADAPGALDGSLAACRRLGTTTRRILDFMRTHDVRSVLIDANHSTCLIEVLPFDCEVFVLHDPMIPYGDAAFVLLSKRVHYLASIEAFDDVSRAFAAGTLAPRRDGGFVERYVAPPGTDVARQIVSAILGGPPAVRAAAAPPLSREAGVPRVR